MTVLDAVSGRIIDTDNHEFVPAHMWVEQFGEASKPIADFFMRLHDPNGLASYTAPVYEDEGPVSGSSSRKAGEPTARRSGRSPPARST